MKSTGHLPKDTIPNHHLTDATQPLTVTYAHVKLCKQLNLRAMFMSYNSETFMPYTIESKYKHGQSHHNNYHKPHKYNNLK